MRKQEVKLLEKLLKELNEPINGHSSRESEIRAKRNERLLREYFQYKLSTRHD